MKAVFICLLLGFATKSFSQSDSKLKPEEPSKIKETPSDTLNKISDRNQNDGPVVPLKVERKYVGNNGNGADIYTLTPDNMPSISPDKTYRSGMPVMMFKKKKASKVKQ